MGDIRPSSLRTVTPRPGDEPILIASASGTPARVIVSPTGLDFAISFEPGELSQLQNTGAVAAGNFLYFSIALFPIPAVIVLDEGQRLYGVNPTSSFGTVSLAQSDAFPIDLSKIGKSGLPIHTNVRTLPLPSTLTRRIASAGERALRVLAIPVTGTTLLSLEDPIQQGAELTQAGNFFELLTFPTTFILAPGQVLYGQGSVTTSIVTVETTNVESVDDLSSLLL